MRSDEEAGSLIDAADLRRVAMPLPRTTEHLVRDWIKFKIGRIVYASISPDETVLGFAFPREERAGLIAAEPEKFHLPRPSDLRYNWVHAWTAALDRDELRDIVVSAWQMCVPRRVAAEYAAGLASPGTVPDELG